MVLLRDKPQSTVTYLWILCKSGNYYRWNFLEAWKGVSIISLPFIPIAHIVTTLSGLASSHNKYKYCNCLQKIVFISIFFLKVHENYKMIQINYQLTVFMFCLCSVQEASPFSYVNIFLAV